MAYELGFDVCGIASTARSQYADYLKRWVAEGKAGEMQWLARNVERRIDLEAVLPGARCVVVVGLNYYQKDSESGEGKHGRVARYALGGDYHEIMEPRLRLLAGRLTEQGAQSKVYVDTGPVMEKPLGQRAGLGWQAKSTMLLSEKFGPWLFLGEVITTLDLEPDKPGADRCGKCTRCLVACPTEAITAPYQLDARRCIAYLTIELKGSIPLEFRRMIGDRIYGCDECLEVCPWNRFAQQTREVKFARVAGVEMGLHELLSLTNEAFKQAFRGSPILRVKRRGLLRNVCVALGNIGTAEDVPILKRALEDKEELIREHAAWAISEIEGRVLQP